MKFAVWRGEVSDGWIFDGGFEGVWGTYRLGSCLVVMRSARLRGTELRRLLP